MEAAARRLNLKGHMAGLPTGTRAFLYSCADIEGHRGFDGRYYVLDFARVFPPTHEEEYVPFISLPLPLRLQLHLQLQPLRV